jgi:hypothetical protein
MLPNLHHRLELVATKGETDELFCPICGRHILVQWPPDYRKTILQEGDNTIIHDFGKGGLDVSSVEIQDPRLSVFEDFLKNK